MDRAEHDIKQALNAAYHAGYENGIHSYHEGKPADLKQDFDLFLRTAFPDGLPQSDAVLGVKGYHDLANMLNRALEQAAFGKGEERHAGGRPFHEQPIMHIQRMVGHGYARGQAIKKLEEAQTLLESRGREPAQAELLGAIVYAAAACLYIEE